MRLASRRKPKSARGPRPRRRARGAATPEVDACQAVLKQSAREGVILFSRARAELDRRSYETLDRLVAVIRACPDVDIEIAGHTDSDGSQRRNQRLSERRAEAVASYLIKSGVPERRLMTIGYGELRPVAPNDTPENKARNRRIEFTVKTQ